MEGEKKAFQYCWKMPAARCRTFVVVVFTFCPSVEMSALYLLQSVLLFLEQVTLPKQVFAEHCFLLRKSFTKDWR